MRCVAVVMGLVAVVILGGLPDRLVLVVMAVAVACSLVAVVRHEVALWRRASRAVSGSVGSAMSEGGTE